MACTADADCTGANQVCDVGGTDVCVCDTGFTDDGTGTCVADTLGMLYHILEIAFLAKNHCELHWNLKPSF